MMPGRQRGSGLLTPEGLQRLINAELERQQRDAYFFAVADTLAALDEPPLSADEIQAEIDAYRAEQRAARANRR